MEQEVFVHELSGEEEKLLAEAEALLKREEKSDIMSGVWFKPKVNKFKVMPIARESAAMIFPGRHNEVRVP